MAADGETDIGYFHHPGYSTSGFFYNDNHMNVLWWFPRNLDLPLFRIPHPGPAGSFIICSSTRGLIALRHSNNTNLYHIGNPLVNIPDINTAFTVLPPTPRPHHPHNTHVVLAIIPERSRYHLICAIRRGPSNYTFDVYTSDTGRWHSPRDEQVDLWGYDIKPNSGVSCGKYAFWLTDTPGMVLGFDVFCRWAVIFKGPLTENAVLDHPATSLQLGRVGEQLGLVLINGRDREIELHTVGTDGITSGVELDPGFEAALQHEELLNLNNGIVIRVLQNDSRMLHQHRCTFFDLDAQVDREIRGWWMPRPVRFESFKMEVPLWVDGWLLLWEENGVEDWRQRVLPVTQPVGIGIADGFPHVCTGSLPGDFPVMMNNDQEMDPDSSVGSN